jgi:dTDP-glucose 4,6-dehydratase
MNVLVTGGAGFIGSHLIEHLIGTTDWTVVCLDKLSYASKGWSRLKDSDMYQNPRVKCITWDLELPLSEGLILELGDIHLIIHMAAETHVDRSIVDPVGTIRNNVMSTVYLLEYARTLKNLKMFQYFSTDEIYGPAPKGISYKEWDPHHPTNPYSASKAASEDICIAYQNTYKIPLLITNLMNAYGNRQFVEKFIGIIINKILRGQEIIIHTESDGETPGSRFYIHVSNISSAILFILERGKPGEKYNITGEQEVNNLELAQKIAAIMGRKLKYKLVSAPIDRPGHDIRYGIDGSKLLDMGWKHESNFDELLTETVKWTLAHPEWLEE